MSPTFYQKLSKKAPAFMQTTTHDFVLAQKATDDPEVLPQEATDAWRIRWAYGKKQPILHFVQGQAFSSYGEGTEGFEDKLLCLSAWG